MTNTINEKTCPFCQALNACMAKTEKACWCNYVQIPTTLIDLVPVDLQGKSCICLACINLFNENPALFKSKYSVLLNKL